jgi:hypothetical protein
MMIRSRGGRAYDLYRGRGRFWWEVLRERHHMEDLGTDGKIILK